MPALLLKADTSESTRMALTHAKEVILSVGVVAVPTASFYGLAVSVRDENAIHRLMFVKKRPEKNPILITIPPGVLEPGTNQVSVRAYGFAKITALETLRLEIHSDLLAWASQV